MSESVDVLVVGAGLSGIGAAARLRTECPDLTVAVVEARAASGGTWDQFRYPGVRSDSDMFTLGYDFRPWTSPAVIADGRSILEYIRTVAAEYRVDELIRYRHRVVSADWSTDTARWTVHVAVDGDGESRDIVIEARFLFCCSGYYRYDRGHDAALPGLERFAGTVVHPQFWPADLAVAGRRVAVVGSGATAYTLVPALDALGAAVTMVQRSPSWVMALPTRDPVDALLHWVLPVRAAAKAVRGKHIAAVVAGYRVARAFPGPTGRMLRRAVVKRLPAGYPVDPHFTPRYKPWDQRMCFVPDGDFLDSVAAGRAAVVTGEIESIEPDGLTMSDGTRVEADIIVTATGLEVQVFGGIALSVDGAPVDLPATVAYKGVMLAGIPNFAFAVGYTNASWTMKINLVTSYVCRLLRHMTEHGFSTATPRPAPPGERRPLVDLQAGYLLRARHLLPSQGNREPWRIRQSYPRDVRRFRRGPVDDEMDFAVAPTAGAAMTR